MGAKGGGRRGVRGGGGGAATEPSPAEVAAGGMSPGDTFGPSNAKVEYADHFTEAGRQNVDREMKETFGRRPSDRELASMVGAPDNATVTLHRNVGGEGFAIAVNSPDMTAMRTIYKERGKVVMHNDFFETEKTGTGLGTRVLGQQVEQASKLGVDRIETTAARMAPSATDKGYNGYYTWARLGYNAPLTSRRMAGLPGDLKRATSVNDLMKTKAGRDYWKTHGTTTEMTFDLKPGSLSRRTLDAYTAEKKRGR